MAHVAINVYDIGDIARCTGTFTDIDDDPADPTSVVFRYEKPDGTETALTYGVDGAVIRDSIGVYHVDLTIAAGEYGRWHYRWTGTGALVAAGESRFQVRRQDF